MEAERREQDLEEAQADAETDAQQMEDQAAELGESIDDAREARDHAEEEQRIAGVGQDPDADRMEEDPPAPAQEPPGDGD